MCGMPPKGGQAHCASSQLRVDLRPRKRQAEAKMTNWLFRYQEIARALTWAGAFAIVVLSVVPANDRPFTGTGQSFEHFLAFALLAGMFAVGYRLSLAQRLIFAFLFCGGVELLQVPLATRHARLSDFVIDLLASWFAIAIVLSSEKLVGVHRAQKDELKKW